MQFMHHGDNVHPKYAIEITEYRERTVWRSVYKTKIDRIEVISRSEGYEVSSVDNIGGSIVSEGHPNYQSAFISAIEFISCFGGYVEQQK